MNAQTKTAFCWLLLGICYLTHTLLHMFGLFYGADIRLPEATGEVSLWVQAFNTVIFTATLLMSFLSLLFFGKGFRRFSLVWGLLLLLLNLFHLATTLFVETFDLSQACLQAFVPAVNAVLAFELWKSLKQERQRAA
ncbi:MAG: hypothetical protein LBH06_08340 [Rikenellaceae bacterium]|jgi:hypothetical protein|nr:hypothetical protein [Rikenellaceae bacterium]